MSEPKHQQDNERHRPPLHEVLSLLLNRDPEDWTQHSTKDLWGAFCRSQSQRLARVVAEMKLSREQIEDLTQEVHRKILARWEEFRRLGGAEELLALSSKMMHDDAVDLIRRLNVSRATALDTELAESLVSKVGELAALVAANELRQWLEAGLAELEKENADHAWLLREHFLKERAIQDLAEEKGVTVHALHCQKTRALQEMHQLLSGRHPSDEASP